MGETGYVGMMGHERLCLLAVVWLIVSSARYSLAECGGRIRVNGSEGWIAVPSEGDMYANRLQCTWFIESDSSVPYVRLKFSAFSTEYLWDYLHVFNGDSVYGEKVAALSGQIVAADPPMAEMATNTSSGGSGDDTDLFEFETELTLSETQVLLFLFTDAGKMDTGFNVSYWTSGCVDNCTGNGQCEESTGHCTCDPGWTGEYCQNPACPNNCAGHGECDEANKTCKCDSGYTGYDCFIPTVEPHWEAVLYTSPLGPELLGRASHSAVVHGQHMWVYGGYRLGDGQVAALDQPGSPDDLVRYDFSTLSWDVPELVDEPIRPSPRYGHSAVIFDDVMYVYGGALLPSEEVTNELWALHLPSLTWTLVNAMESSGSGTENDTVVLPIAVRDHTAHVVGNRMVVLFGYAPDTNDVTLNFVQEYDLVDGIWSAPTQFGDIPNWRMGHKSVYVPELNTVYVHGGYSITRGNADGLRDLYTYNPVDHIWRNLASSCGFLGYHSLVVLGGVLVAFGGTAQECFQDNVLFYNIFCDSWTSVDVPGLYGNGSRFGHSAVVDPSGMMAVFGGFIGRPRHDLLLFDSGDCSRFTERTDCLNASNGLCGWSITNNSCASVQLPSGSDLILQCSENEPSSPTDECVVHYACPQCVAGTDCVWNSGTQRCLNLLDIDNTTLPTDLVNSTTGNCLEEVVATCNVYKSCSTCSAHSVCEWGDNLSCNTRDYDNETNISAACAAPENACAMTNSCSECTAISDCLWCPSLSKCVNSKAYPYSFLYGQCLEWVDGNSFDCPAENCQEPGCELCQQQPGCGWCRDARDTGLGTCAEGGFQEPRNLTTCPDGHWFFDQCPLCNCNGHSQCHPGTSTCIECQNNTKGTNCEQCVDGLFGDPRYGSDCSVCECNGYNDVCNNTSGNCMCLDAGVTGNRCTLCKTTENFGGNASNFCFYYMQVGFIYTFTVDPGDYQWFFATVPEGGSFINFKFDISSNPTNQIVVVQLFLARVSENFQILFNLTDPIQIGELNYYSNTFESFDSYNNNSGLFSFLREELRNNQSFVQMFSRASANSYSTALWDGDLALVIYASNLTSNMQFKITIDQQDLIILLYFFTTFLTCFTLMISGFFVGWYIKRKLEIRAYIRAQHIEMQRRVRRPFARLKAVVEKSMAVEAKQSASYVSVEMCRDGRAAILTVLVRLPWDVSTSHPSMNRSGVCFGSTLVKMNSKPKDSKKKGSHHHRTGEETDTSTST